MVLDCPMLYPLSSAFGSLRYPWWMVILVMPIMLSAEAVYTIVDKHRLLMGFLGATVSSDLKFSYPSIWFMVLSQYCLQH